LSPTTPGARSAAGRTRKPLGWLPWVVLLLLALVIAVIVIVIANVRDDDDTAPRASPVPSAVIAA
jgi:hypothetical protein